MFKMNLKKALALLASVLMLCSLVPVGALLAANADSNNLLTNGGFEDGETGWAFNSGSHAIVTDAHSGGKALSLTNPGMWAEGAITTISVSPNTDYTITWWCKATAGTGTFNLYVMDGSTFANMATVSGQNWMNNFSGAWQQKTYTVKSGSANSMMLKFSTEASNPGTVLLDDVTVTKVGGDEPINPPAPSGNNMLVNGDFETGEITPWENVWGSNTVSIVSGRNGGSALNIVSGQWKIVRQKVTVEANTDYVIKVWAKDVKDMTLLIKDGADTVNVKQTTINGGSDWVETTLELNSGNYTEIYVCLMGNVADSKGTFDDAVMTKKGVEPDVPDQPIDVAIVNGDFETGDNTGWQTHQSSAIEAGAAHDGSYGAHLKGTGGWGGMLNQAITVNAGESYEISFWVKVNANGMNLQIKDGGETGANLDGDWYDANAVANWTEKKYIVTPTTDTIFLNFCGAGNGVAEDAYVDSFVISALKEASFDGYITNGDFETGKPDSWENVWDGNTISIVAGHDSANALNIVSGEWKIVRQKVTVEANTDYVITGWAKDVTDMTLLVKDGNDTVNVAQNAFAAGGSWSKTTLEFNSGVNTSVFICLMGTSANAKGIFDDFSMAKKGEEPGPDPDVPSDALIVNGDFETGEIAPWENVWDSCTVSMVAGRDSANALSIVSGEWNIVRQKVTVEANTDYVITGWAKDVTDMTLLVKDGGDTTNVAQSGMAAGANWTKVSLEFNSGSYTSVYVCLMGTSANAKGIFDDFSMEKKGDEPGPGPDPDVPTYPTELVNGNFEDGTNGWSVNGNASIDSDAHAGTGALKLDNPSAWSEAAMQAVSVQKDTNYVISWYAKRVDGNGPFNLILMNDANQNYSVDGQNWMNETSGEWVKYEIVLSTGANDVVKFKFTSEANGSGTILIDDIKMIIEGSEPVDPTASLIKNGSFESGKDDWSWGGESVVLDGDYYEGAHSAKLVNNSAWGVGVEQVVKVEKNTDYVLRFYTKRVNGNGVWVLSLMDNDTVNITNVNLEVTSGQKWFSHTTTNKWEEHIIEFNSGEVTKVLVKFGPEADNSGSFLLDYVGMWTKGNEPSPDNPDNPVVPPKAQMFMTSFGVLNNRPIDPDSNMLSNPSFEKSGGQWKEGFKGETISVVNDSTTLFGDKSLFFNTAGIEDEVKLIFWMDVEVDTAYVFSTWLKGAYLADDNRGLATIGIVDENGKFLSNLYQEGDITRFLNGERQIVPTAWDNEWHLRGIEFNSGECTKVGIALAGKNSQMWIDDMALFKVGEGVKYMSENAAGTVGLSYDISDVTCKDEDSLIPDPNFSKGVNDFWKTSYGWRNGFLTFVENKYEYGTSLKYTASEEIAPLSIIKTIEVEPNTDYTFAVDLKILEDGWGKLMLCDGKKREPISFLEVSFDSYDYDEDDGYYGWYTTACKFNTDVYDTISLVIVDDGGEVLLDNMRLYKSEDGDASITDAFTPPPEEPSEPGDDWYDDNGWYDPEIPVEPDAPVEDNPPIEEPDPYDPSVDQPEPVPTDPVAPVVVDEGSDAWIWIAIGGGAALLAGAGVFLFFFLKKKKTTPPTE